MWQLWGESFCVQSLLPSMRPSPDLLLGNKTQGSSERTRIVQQTLRASSTTAKPASTGVCVRNRAWSQTFLKHQSDQSSPPLWQRNFPSSFNLCSSSSSNSSNNSCSHQLTLPLYLLKGSPAAKQGQNTAKKYITLNKNSGWMTKMRLFTIL